jgi:hypothetical protein
MRMLNSIMEIAFLMVEVFRRMSRKVRDIFDLPQIKAMRMLNSIMEIAF